jgi:hypothetical protein
MSKFEQSRPDHEVHEIHQHQGHGMLDQKRAKGMRSPITAQVPQVDNGTAGVPGGQPMGQYAPTDVTGS